MNTRAGRLNHNLHDAIKAKRLDEMERLLKAGANLNHTAEEQGRDMLDEQESQPPLITALETHDPDIVRWVLERGADIDLYFNPYFTPLSVAMRKCSHDIVELMLDYKPDLNRALHSLVGHKDIHGIRRLLKLGADIDAPFEGEIALHRAVRIKGIFSSLLYEGADPHLTDTDTLEGHLAALKAQEDSQADRQDPPQEHRWLMSSLTAYRARLDKETNAQKELLTDGSVTIDQRLTRLLHPERYMAIVAPANPWLSPANHPGDNVNWLRCLLVNRRYEDIFSEALWKGREPELLEIHERVAQAMSPQDRERFRSDADISWARREQATSFDNESAVRKWAQRRNASKREVG